MVYEYHFSQKIHHAGHYIGYCSDERFEERQKEHERGCGARLTQVAVERGITLKLARVWPGKGRKFERMLKIKNKNGPRLCPICTPGAEQRMKG
jgi:hypothetical protein